VAEVSVAAREREPQRRGEAARHARRHDRKAERDGRTREGAAQTDGAAGEAGAGAPPAVEPEPSPSPTAPPIPPAPTWTFSFGVGWRSVEACGCDPTPRLVSSSVEGTIQDGFTFSQVVEGAIYDADAGPTWPFHLELAGDAGPAGGHLEHRFVLWSLAGAYSYAGEASLDSVAVGGDGAVTYRFVGSYALEEGQEPVAGVPQRGVITATLSVWPDGTLFAGSVALAEAAP
jgi:hypothetical protein